MRAALCKSLDGPEAVVIEDVAEPTVDPRQVIVEVHAAALNFFDVLMTRGKYQFQPELPFSPSGEIAGKVAKVGSDVDPSLVGSRVAAYIGWGGAREKTVVDAASLVHIPDGLPDEAAACAAIAYGTAMHGLRDRGRLQAGETVAVLGAAGGAGLAAIEIAKLMGARVIAVASSAEKLDICRSHGADDLVDYAARDLKQSLRDLTGGRGADIIYDCVGGASTEKALRATAWAGRYLVVGFAAGEIPRIPFNLLLLKGCEAVGVFWGEFVRRHPDAHIANMGQVLNWAAKGQLKITVQRTFSLESIVGALQMLDRREAKGKIVIKP